MWMSGHKESGNENYHLCESLIPGQPLFWQSGIGFAWPSIPKTSSIPSILKAFSLMQPSWFLKSSWPWKFTEHLSFLKYLRLWQWLWKRVIRATRQDGLPCVCWLPGAQSWRSQIPERVHIRQVKDCTSWCHRWFSGFTSCKICEKQHRRQQ